MEYAVSVESFLSSLQRHNPHQPEYLQAVREVFTSLWPFIERNPRYREQALLERPVEPERVIQFRVSWVDDRGGCRSTAPSACSSTRPSAPTRAACASTRR